MVYTRFSSSLMALLFASSTSAAPNVPNAEINAAHDVATAQQRINTLAVPFVPNGGQWDRRGAFKANTLGGAVFVTTGGALVYSFPGKALDSEPATERAKRSSRHVAAERGPGWALTETLIDRKGQTRTLKPSGLGPNETNVSYFTADSAANGDRPMHTYSRVQLGEVYPGVNLQLRATGNNMEKIFTVAPGHNPNQIQLKLDGAERLEVNAAGHLVAHTGNGPISFTAPIAFQEDAQGKRDAITVAYVLDADHARYGFMLGDYDATRALTIDPLLQSTYLGGSANDQVNAVTVHPVSGEVIVAGYTYSTDLPGTAGSAGPTIGGRIPFTGASDAFVSRFNASLTILLQSTYLGGSDDDFATAVTVHPVSGEVIVAGYTRATNLPGTAGGAQPAFGGITDAFVSRFNASLTTLLQSTYLGGSENDQVNAVAVHPVSGEVIVAGYTNSTNLPGTAGGAQPTGSGGDGFVSRFNASLTNLLQSSYLSGDHGASVAAVTVHPVSGEVIVAGSTQSVSLPGSAGGAQVANTGPFGTFNGFVSRFNPTLTGLLQSSYLGGSRDSYATAVTVHPVSGEVYIAGYTQSINLSATAGGAQATSDGGLFGTFHPFVSRFNARLNALLQSSYLGGSGDDRANAVAVHPVSGEVIVAGFSSSTLLPGSAGGAQATSGGAGDAFVSRLNASLTVLVQSSYLGGNGIDEAKAVTVHPVSGEVIVAGRAGSTNLPGTAGGAQPANAGGGNGDAFVSRLTPDLTANNTTPNAFSFTKQINVPRSTVRTSNPALISGLSGSARIYAEGQLGSSYSVSSTNSCAGDLSGGFVSTLGSVGNGNYVCSRHTASAANNDVTKTVVHIGVETASFLVSTGTAFTACSLDVDGNGTINALTDGLMIVRAMLGFTGSAVTNGAIVGSPPRATWAAIQPFLNSNCGTSFLP